MRQSFKRYKKYFSGCLIILLTVTFVYLLSEEIFHNPNLADAKIVKEKVKLDKTNPRIQEVMAIQNRHTKKLMVNPDIIGTATGLTNDGNPAIIILTKKKVKNGVIPKSLDGKPVVEKITGEFFPIKPPPGKGNNAKPKVKYNPPVPIGVSTGNERECSAGTIGARVTDDTNVYALSNNHVYALENQAIQGDRIFQPGLYDTNCRLNDRKMSQIGTLVDYVLIHFNNSDTCDPDNNLLGDCNTVDAAIALSSEEMLSNATPSDGYGIPSSTTVPPEVLQIVYKYGRTSALTNGIIYGINGTVKVGYGSGKAIFINQILVEGSTGFIQPGDSGSLLVTSHSEPVGLLFAGNYYGYLAVANPIDEVLNAFSVHIDGM